LTEGEYARLERAVYQVTSAESAEVAALECSWFFILSDGGLRINELLTLVVGDWDPDRRLLTIRFGKRGHQRHVPLTARAAKAMDVHLANRQPVHADEPLLVYNSKPLQKFHVTRWLSIFAAKAQLGHITPHRLRHTYATRLISTGKMSIISLQKLMGHRQLDTTMRYVALYDEKVQQDYQTAMTKLEVETEPDWDLWGPTIDTALAQDVPVAASL
jgi:integrase/recombinase XerD